MKLSKVFLWVFFLVLITLPATVQGEFVLYAGCWAVVGGNVPHISGEQVLYNEGYIVDGSSDGSVQNPGLEVGFTFWFRRLPVLGIGLDCTMSNVAFGDAHMTMMTASSCLLLRIPLCKSPGFERGRLFPYIGLGVAFERLEGPVNIFFKKADRQLEAPGLLGKIGLEFMMSGGLSVFVEARYMKCAFTYDNVDEQYWGWYWFFPVIVGEDTTHLEANLDQAQISIGIALHLGK